MTEEITRTHSTGVAGRLVDLLVQVYGEAPPVTFTAWDGSRVDPESGDVGIAAHLESRRTVRRLMWSPGQEGIAKAYIAGELTIDGDLETAVRLMRDYVEQASAKRTLEPADRREVLRLTVQLGAVGPAPRGPSEPVDAVTGYLDVPGQMRTELPAELADAVLGHAAGEDAGRAETVYTDPEPLSASIGRWEQEGLVVDAVREVVSEERDRLRDIGARLEEHWDAVVDAVGAQHARMWRVSLVLVRDNLERRTVRAYEITGTPSAD
ncbi:hypothetical protein FE697_011405 [Mumia zhuanghuii]|uniref:SCP-2 sterol transfer family protein n=2 Tax=Mumia TaxID=1546255 RepID=A0ABW1QFF1_9ACTN|nr:MULTISPECIES: hypothetical protein [Mumia]KAA1422765.1 hypothetical protein FE697_011405 [Mumia zhuanghuii]